MLVSLTHAVRRKFRSLYQRVLISSILLGVVVFSFSYLSLEFCYKILSSSSLSHMCNQYKQNQYSGALCEELCNGESFKDFKCPHNSMKTIMFTAVKNNDIYAIKLAKHITDDLTWRDKNGLTRYPEMLEFQNIIKQYITITYNVTIEDTVIHALLTQEIDPHNPEQMLSLWRLFKDNNYMMGKLYEEESIFPNILGSCGPYYATENLDSIQPETGLRHYITIDWEGRLKFALMIMEFLHRLDTIKPEPLKMCKVEPHHFGITFDKRIKYQTAQYILSEFQLERLLTDGSHCEVDSDCVYEYCLGKCDETRKICTGQQQNNNLQIVCQYIFKGTRLFPGLLSTAKAPSSLLALLNICIDPSKNEKQHIPNRLYAPTLEIGSKLYNEIKRIHDELTFRA
ncbi:divergent protein kinase domain 1C [Condylostylus longicornis]|uniref:divergent protein kinase domain 1C n=1 Tax=Condylostylus longicornis TaxID=2530218 RepID=UPI00244DB10A|nr:divergent protein kinase domain 1C [Condylostylus longicornis]